MGYWRAMDVRPHRFATRDPASAEEFLRDRWDSLGKVEFGPRFSIEVSGIQAPDFRVERLSHSSSIRVTATAPGPVQVVEVLGGTITVEDGDTVTRMGPGELFAIDAVITPSTTSRSVHVGVVTLSRELLGQVAGVPADRLRIPRRQPLPAAADQWRLAVRRANREISEHLRRGTRPPIDVAHRLAQAALTAFGVETVPLELTDAEGLGPQHPVNQAIAFIEAHAGESLSVTDIAHAARTSVRALQQGFARHHDTSPTAYLRRVRLEGAHRELAAAEPTGPVTVADVAARWGFSQAGRFAAHYREAFGVLPSETLRARPHVSPLSGGAE